MGATNGPWYRHAGGAMLRAAALSLHRLPAAIEPVREPDGRVIMRGYVAAPPRAALQQSITRPFPTGTCSPTTAFASPPSPRRLPKGYLACGC